MQLLDQQKHDQSISMWPINTYRSCRPKAVIENHRNGHSCQYPDHPTRHRSPPRTIKFKGLKKTCVAPAVAVETKWKKIAHKETRY